MGNINSKRISIFCGHYGSGKTNMAVNYAFDLRKTYNKVAVCDLDIVNPYFRTKDSEEDFRKADIKFISSAFANSNVDIPALPQEIYSVTHDKSYKYVLDIGGDDRGATALGRIATDILDENDYEMFFVTNMYRPLTRDAESAVEIMREIEAICKLKFTAIINNSNLGRETKAEDIIDSLDYAQEISKITSLPIKFTTVCSEISDGLTAKINNLYEIKLQKKI